jgi:uncharacterized protein
MKRIFIDTGAWIALNSKKDKHFKDAISANKSFLNDGYYYVTSDYVLDETFTLLRSVVGHKRAVEFGNEILSLKDMSKILVFHTDQVILDRAWKIFETYSDKGFSFTDCTSFSIMKRLKIKEAFSFDKHFDQYGFLRLPFL